MIEKNRKHGGLTESDEVVIFCADCRGKFSVNGGDIVEEEVIECTLCAAEMVVLSEDPVKIRLYSEDEMFS